MAERTRPVLLVVLALVLALAAGARLVHHDRTPLPDAPEGSGPDAPEGPGWFAYDPDSSYQMRRLQRALDEGLPVARTDPYLAHPEGSAIPWPPAYTYVLWAAFAPFHQGDAGDVDEARGRIERGVATLPVVFGVLTSLAAALAGWILAGRNGALVAGAHHALTLGSILYSRQGNGDHHAFVSMIDALVLLLLCAALARGAVDDPRRAWKWGAAIGALAAWNLVTWVAALLYVIQVEVVLGVLLFLHARRACAGLAAFGLSFHLAALAVTLPFCATSPWNESHPWIVVNLSWFHPAFLATGALVFVPLLFLRERSAVARVYPLLVGAALGLAYFALRVFDTPIGAGMQEGFAWVSSIETFMSDITESRPLLGAGANPEDLFGFLGYSVVLLPVAWGAALLVLLLRGERALLPWVVAVPLLGLQAATQMRFADGLSMPFAVLIGWGAARLLEARPLRAVTALPAVAQGALLLVLVGLGQWHGVWGTSRLATTAPVEHRMALRELLDWLRANTPAGAGVLAHWDRGHPIEWAADRPAVATNFGSYVGLDSFQAPPRFFLAEDRAAAEAVLVEREARYVLVSARLPWLLPFLEKALDPAAEPRLARKVDGDVLIDERWFRTVGAALVLQERTRGPEVAPLDFLRLVHVSPTVVDDTPLASLVPRTPYGWIFEHVPGATLEVTTRPGDTLTARVEVAYPGRDRPLVWSGSAVADAAGLARLRVPYCTTDANGDGSAAGPVTWSVSDGVSGTVDVSGADVSAGATIRLR